MNELALFIGGGGGALGSQLIGHRIVCAVENDPYCREVIMRRQEEGHLQAFPIWDDARTFDGKPWRGIVDIVTAGFPCQPFSLAGKRKGIDDERNLWPETYRIIQEVDSRYVMLENVPGIRKYLPVVIRDLRRAGYTVKRPLIVAAAAVGAGHIRKRVWIFAYNEEQCRGTMLHQKKTWGRQFRNGNKQEISPDNIGMRQREQSRRRSGKDRVTSSVGENSTKTELFTYSEHEGFPQRQSESENNAKECQAFERDDCRRVPWWDSEPGLARLVHRSTNRVERIRISGNIQIPAVVVLAWKILNNFNNKQEGVMSKKLKVFGFMINPHEMMIVSEDGQKCDQIKVDSDVQAKEKFMSEDLNQQLISTLGRTDFSTIWIDDPAGNQEVIEACKKMEQEHAGLLNVDEENEDLADKPIESEVIELQTAGYVFQLDVEGTFKNIPGKLLKKDDICRYFLQGNQVDETQWMVIENPIGEKENYVVKLKKINNAASPKEESEERSEPQFDTTGKTKIIEVECPETYSEQEMKRLGRQIRDLKAEALQTASQYREEIKTLEKRFFQMCDGKSYTQMECTIENDWEAGERKYIRPDTGEIARLEKIPYEEQQLNMNKDLEADTSEEETLDEAVVKNENGESSDETEQVTEETDHAESETETNDNETTEQEPDDFPPPEEDGTLKEKPVGSVN